MPVVLPSLRRRQGTTMRDLGTMVAALDGGFTHFHPARPFSGLPSESAVQFGHDVRLALMTAAPRRFTNHAKRIVYAASFLDGPALGWYHALLRRNAVAIGELVEEAEGRPRPQYWSTWPFVITQLRTVEAFLDALAVEFPGTEAAESKGGGDCKPSARAHHATGGVEESSPEAPSGTLISARLELATL